jgi:hypothetical protein
MRLQKDWRQGNKENTTISLVEFVAINHDNNQ